MQIIQPQNKDKWAIAFIWIAAIVLQLPYLNEFPAYFHAWCQADWYAIAKGFLNNGFDFFHPESYIYNKQFPDDFIKPYGDTITSVDFPIHCYIVAILMKLFGTSAPWVFHCWTLLCSLVGLMFLYKLAKRLTNDEVKALLVVFFTMTSPVYGQHFAGYLPCAPAVAWTCVGLWAYLRYYEEGKQKYFIIGVAFLTLATLIRTTFLIVLVAIFCFEFLRVLRKESTWKDKLLPIFLSLLLIAGFFLWNLHLRTEHGTLFLNKLRPAESWADALRIIKWAIKSWTFHYLTPIHYLLLVVFVAWFGHIMFCHRKERQTATSKVSLWWLCGGWFFGCVLFFIAMFKQYEDHDYYFVDTFFLPLVFFVVLLLRKIPLNTWGKRVLLIAMVLLWASAATMLNYRRGWGNETHQTELRFEGADQFLDSAGVSRDAKIIALYVYPQNVPFLKMERKGYTAMNTTDSVAIKALTWDYDYIVIENVVLEREFYEAEAILSHLYKVADNGRISLCRYSDTVVCKSPEAFLGKAYNWVNLPCSLQLNDNEEYPCNIQTQPFSKDFKRVEVHYTIDVNIAKTTQPIYIVQELKDANGNVLDWRNRKLQPTNYTAYNQWNRLEYVDFVSDVKAGQQYNVYFWNPDKVGLQLKDGTATERAR